MALVCGAAKKETRIRDNGNSVSLKVTVYILGSTAILTKDNSKNA